MMRSNRLKVDREKFFRLKNELDLKASDDDNDGQATSNQGNVIACHVTFYFCTLTLPRSALPVIILALR